MVIKTSHHNLSEPQRGSTTVTTGATRGLRTDHLNHLNSSHPELVEGLNSKLQTMFPITTSQFTKYTPSQMQQFILSQHTDHFEIIVPRRRTLATHKKYQVFWEYHLAAYAGHLIAAVGESFAYNVPSPHSRRPFRFEIHTRNHQQFIDALSTIITSIYFKHDINPFETAAGKFFLNAFSPGATPATIGLIITANHILGNDEPMH